MTWFPRLTAAAIRAFIGSHPHRSRRSPESGSASGGGDVTPPELAMALYPCEVDRQRYPGPQNTAYVGLLRQAERGSRRLRLCNNHLTELMEAVRLTMITEDAPAQQALQSQCANCTSPLDWTTRYAVFLTAYPSGSGRQDYYAELCGRCVTKVALRFDLQVP